MKTTNINQTLLNNRIKISAEVMNNPKKYANASMLFSDKDIFMKSVKRLDATQAKGVRRVLIKLGREIAKHKMDGYEIIEITKDFELLATKIVTTVMKKCKG